LISKIRNHYLPYFTTLHHELFISFNTILFFWVSINFGCKHTRARVEQPIVLQEALNKAHMLYKRIGHDELDPISEMLEVYKKRLASYDTSATKPGYLAKMQHYQQELSQCLSSFNEFYEEIYEVEDDLLMLESSFRIGKTGRNAMKEQVKKEESLLENISLRIDRVRQRTDSLLIDLTGLEQQE
jgi:hypothetical protein